MATVVVCWVLWSRLCSSCSEFLWAQGDFVITVGDARGCGGEFGGIEAVEDLIDPGGVGAKHGHEVRGGHLLPSAGEECLEPQQIHRVPGCEHRQRAEQA